VRVAKQMVLYNLLDALTSSQVQVQTQGGREGCTGMKGPPGQATAAARWGVCVYRGGLPRRTPGVCWSAKLLGASWPAPGFGRPREEGRGGCGPPASRLQRRPAGPCGVGLAALPCADPAAAARAHAAGTAWQRRLTAPRPLTPPPRRAATGHWQAAVLGVTCQWDVQDAMEKRVRSRFSSRRVLLPPLDATQVGRRGAGASGGGAKGAGRRLSWQSADDVRTHAGVAHRGLVLFGL
jgi:hypothetical protein